MADSSRNNLRKLKDEYARNPGSRVFVHLAEAYRKAGELRQAHQVLTDGLKRHVDYPSGMVVLAKVLADQGETERAAAVWRDVARLDPENVVALRALGDLAEAAGRRDEAMQYYRRIVRLENGEPNADDLPFGGTGFGGDDDEPAPFASAPARGGEAPERGNHAPEPAKSRFSWLVRSVARVPAAEPQPARASFGEPSPATAQVPAAATPAAARAEAPAAPSHAEAPAAPVQPAPVAAPVEAAPEPQQTPSEEPAEAAARTGGEPVHPNPAEGSVSTQVDAGEEVEDRAFSEIAAVEDAPGFADAPRADEAPEPVAADESHAVDETDTALVEEDDFPARAYDRAPAVAGDHESFIDVDPEDPDGPYVDVRTEVPEPPVDDAEVDESDHAEAQEATMSATRGEANVRGAAGSAPEAGPDSSETFEGIFDVDRETLLEAADGDVVILGGDGAPAGEEPGDARAGHEEHAQRTDAFGSREGSGAALPEVEEEAYDEPEAEPVSFEELARLAYERDAAPADPFAQIRKDLYGAGAEAAGETMPGVAGALAEVLVRMLEREGSVMHAESSLRRLLAVALARELGLGEAQQEALSLAATLGAIGELREEDAGDTGRNQAVTLQLLAGVALPDATREALAHQYERWDGAGLPSGLKEEQIPFPARVLAVARGAPALLGRNRAGAAPVVDALQRHAGTAFDPLVVSVLRRVFAQRERHGIGYGWGGRVAIAHPHELRGLEIAAQLHAEGYEAETAGTAADLREHLHGGAAEALIVGAELPDADVAALVRELRAQAPTLPVLVVDAADARRRVELLGAGADVCFPAGAEFLEVRATLDALLRRGES